MARKPTPAPSARASRSAMARSGQDQNRDAVPKPDWRRRWALIRVVLFYSAALGLYIILFGPDDRLRESALLGLLTLSGAIILGYLGFSAQDDRNWMRSLVEARSAGQARSSGEGRR